MDAEMSIQKMTMGGAMSSPVSTVLHSGMAKMYVVTEPARSPAEAALAAESPAAALQNMQPPSVSRPVSTCAGSSDNLSTRLSEEELLAKAIWTAVKCDAADHG